MARVYISLLLALFLSAPVAALDWKTDKTGGIRMPTVDLEGDTLPSDTDLVCLILPGISAAGKPGDEVFFPVPKQKVNPTSFTAKCSSDGGQTYGEEVVESVQVPTFLAPAAPVLLDAGN